MIILLVATWLAGALAQLTGRYSLVPQALLHGSGGMMVEDTCPPCCSFGKKFECGCLDQGSFVNNPVECPSLHNNTRITPSGSKYYLYCTTQTQRANIKIVPSKDFIECVDICAAQSGCMGVDFDRKTKQCWLKSELISTDDPMNTNPDVDSSALVVPEAKPDENCPELDRQIRFVGGIPFKFFCGLGLLGESLPGLPVKASTLAACGKLCADNSKCQGADYNSVSGACSLKANYLSEPTHPRAQGHSLVPLAKRGNYIFRDL
ncbi:MAG: hypothetical protein M1816_002477 [Peltula sp. TS41687]|nr:MAG: hypothetical protein M1816_002477 [Peltula sp. TS41687]